MEESIVAPAVEVTGVHDPLNPPSINKATQGWVPSAPQEAMWINLLVAEDADTELVMAALMRIMKPVAETTSKAIGDTLMRQDTRYAQRWQPLKESTRKARRYQGRTDMYPYSQKYAEGWQFSRWGTNITQAMDRVSATIGPSEATQSHTDWTQTRLSQYGTPPGHGDGRGNTQQKPPRPIGISEEIARKVQTEVQQRLPPALRAVGLEEDSAVAVISADMLDASYPIWLM